MLDIRGHLLSLVIESLTMLFPKPVVVSVYDDDISPFLLRL
jgi:hypothetical protein